MSNIAFVNLQFEVVRQCGGDANPAMLFGLFEFRLRACGTVREDGAKWLHVTYDEIESMTGLLIRSARTAINKLKKFGMIVQERAKNGMWVRLPDDYEVTKSSFTMGSEMTKSSFIDSHEVTNSSFMGTDEITESSFTPAMSDANVISHNKEIKEKEKSTEEDIQGLKTQDENAEGQKQEPALMKEWRAAVDQVHGYDPFLRDYLAGLVPVIDGDTWAFKVPCQDAIQFRVLYHNKFGIMLGRIMELYGVTISFDIEKPAAPRRDTMVQPVAGG